MKTVIKSIWKITLTETACRGYQIFGFEICIKFYNDYSIPLVAVFCLEYKKLL